MKQFLRPAVLLPILAGIITGSLLFVFGAYDDAPGMCAIGLSIGFILIMLGINGTGIIRKGRLVPILLICFGIFCMLITTAILLDGEFGDNPWYSLFGFSAAAVLLTAGFLRLKVRRGTDQ